MANELLNAAFRGRRNLRAGALLVLARLADRANKAGLAWPTVRRLALDVGLSRRQVQRHLSTLRGMNLVRVHRKATLSRPAVYLILPACPVPRCESATCDVADTSGATRVTPKPSDEPHENRRTGCCAPDSVPPVRRRQRTENQRVLVKLAHAVLDAAEPGAQFADLASDLKTSCANFDVGYQPESVTRALNAVLARRAGGRS